MELDAFESFPKIHRFARTWTATEKIDGTNAQICVTPALDVLAGSRNRWVTPEQDNYGFAAWVAAHVDELRALGVGRHFGEWWGAGIQRRYGLAEKRFSLFNVERWNSEMSPPAPSCCHVVPLLARGADVGEVFAAARADLAEGSRAAPGFKFPEGIVLRHGPSGALFKYTLDGDAIKGAA